MTAYRVLVAGSRMWPERGILFTALDMVLAEHLARESLALEDAGWQVTVVHGMCNPRGQGRRLSWSRALLLPEREQALLLGGDWHAGRWARSRGLMFGGRVTEEPHPADWRDGNGAGMARNGKMVALGAAEALTFFATGARSPGTADLARKARGAGIPVRRYNAGGLIVL